MSNSIILFLAINRRKTRIEIGLFLNYYISDSYASYIIDIMASYIGSEIFYKVWNVIEYFYKEGKNLGDSSNSTNGDGSIQVWTFIFIIIVILLMYVAITYRCYTSGFLTSDGTYTTYRDPGNHSYHSHHHFGAFILVVDDIINVEDIVVQNQRKWSYCKSHWWMVNLLALLFQNIDNIK